MRLRFLVTGRVQGVGFRYFARRVATRLGISGWVNLPDGGVEAVADGSPDALARFQEELRSGPTLAVVENVRAADADPEVLEGFEIR
jgi:acylphosphatase